MLTGCQPYAGTSFVEILSRQLHEAPPAVSSFRPGAGRALDAVMARALCAKPEHRYQNVGELRRAFLTAMAATRAARAAGVQNASLSEMPTQRLSRVDESKP